MTDNTCADCRFFGEPDGDGYPFRGWGDCLRLRDGYDYNNTVDGPEDGRLAIPWDYEGYLARLYVSPKFGCIQYQGKESK